MSVELRLTDIDPPDKEPKRTIYRDIVNLPDPVKLGMTMRYFNHDDVDLYMQITGSCVGYTFGTENLGLLASGANAYKNLDEFASRAKPSTGDLPDGEMEENVTLILKGYTDAGYSNLKWTFERVVTVYWVNSADAAFTVDELDNFDDGTVQGWAGTAEENSSADVEVRSDYVLSTPYSVRLRSVNGNPGQVRARLYKSFTTPNKDKVFAIFDVRVTVIAETGQGVAYAHFLKFQRNSTLLALLGLPGEVVISENKIPVSRWMRAVVPLPKNVTEELRIIIQTYTTGASFTGGYVHLDDFKIISK